MFSVFHVMLITLIPVLTVQTCVLWWFMDVWIGYTILVVVGVNVISTIGGLWALNISNSCTRRLLWSAPNARGTRWMAELADYLEWHDSWQGIYPSDDLDEDGEDHDKMKGANDVASEKLRSLVLDGIAFFYLLALFLAISFVIHLSSYSYLLGSYEQGLIAARWYLLTSIGSFAAFILINRCADNVVKWRRCKTERVDD